MRFKRYEALVKVTSDKRFTEDASADTQDALSEKRKERDELKTALVRDLERAFLSGTLFYGGQEVNLEGVSELKAPLQSALQSVIPNIYPRFGIADRPFDLAKQLKAVLNPVTSNLNAVAPDLDVFDTQGSLQRESALVAQILEVLSDLEDHDIDPEGGRLLDAKEEKGFKGFQRPPFGWPDELVRLILAACFRGGALYLERQTPAGPAPLYDYRGADDIFLKITTFKKATFRVAETPLTVDQIKQASKALIAMGVTNTPESGNAIAAAIRDLGLTLKVQLEDAKARDQQGLPISNAILDGEPALTEPTTAKDPTTTVTSFLQQEEVWKALRQGLEALRSFLKANRHQDYAASRRLLALGEDHPVPETHPKATPFVQARKDMQAIVGEKTVIARWADYRAAFDTAVAAYREAYSQAYERIRKAATDVLSEIENGATYQSAPTPQRDEVVAKIFGHGKVCHYPPVTLSTVNALLDAAAKRSLTSLDQALVALPAYRAQVEADLRGLTMPPPSPGDKIFEWSPVTALAGRRFSKDEEVDETLGAVARDLKAQIRNGFTVVVK